VPNPRLGRCEKNWCHWASAHLKGVRFRSLSAALQTSKVCASRIFDTLLRRGLSYRSPSELSGTANFRYRNPRHPMESGKSHIFWRKQSH
jgi:hypothetical protein